MVEWVSTMLDFMRTEGHGLRPGAANDETVGDGEETGIVWFLWHPQHVIGNSILNKFVSLIFIMLLSYVFGWLFLRSKSVWPCVIMHSFQNESQPQGIFNMSKTPTDIQENVVICIVLLIVTVILFLLEHPITGESIFKHNKYMGLKQK